jgi:type IV pilus assembly protein PilQ
MKFIRYCSIINGILFLIASGSFQNALMGQSYDDLFESISIRMDSLAESIIPGLKEAANISVSGAPLQELLRGVAATHGLNVNIDPNIRGQITNNFNNVQVKDMLLFIIREYRLNVRFFNNIISFYHYQPMVPYVPPANKIIKIDYSPLGNLLTLDLQNDSLSSFVRQVTEKTNKNVILAPGADGIRMNGYIKEMPFDKAIDKIAFMNGMKMEISNDGFYILKIERPLITEDPNRMMDQGMPMNRNNPGARNMAMMQPAGELYVDIHFVEGDSVLTIDAINVPIASIIKEASNRSRRNYIFASEPQGSITCLVRNLQYDQFLAFALQSSEFTYKKQDNVYLIGGRNQEGLRSSRLVKLQYRTIDSLQYFIPDEFKKGIDIKEFKELNAFILTGGASQIDEVALFLREIDQPVPNIMIEVIVADLRKGVSIKTGIRAFLSDSVPANTTGQVFPGLDIAVNSRSINNVLDRLSENGIVNLGRVTPRFYATLQALEQNNMLNLRSTPKLSTLNGHKANLTIGQSRYYLEENQAIAPGVNPFATIAQQWKEVEANLSITIYPMVSGDEHITLDIMAEFSDFIEPEIKGAPPGNATRKFTSKIRVRNEEMIVLGGLEEVRKSHSRSGLPLISRIPVLNWILSARAQDNAEGKLIVFIKPTIVY